MKKFCLLVGLCIFTLSFAIALPSRKIDSLNAILIKLPPEGRTYTGDTIRVQLLCEMGREESNPEIAITFLKQAFELSLKLNKNILCQKTSFLLGKKYKRNGNYFEAIELFYKSLTYAEKRKDDYQRALCYQEIADSYIWLNQPIKCYELYGEALKLYEKLKLYEDYADCLNNLAIAYHDAKQYDNAIELLNKCLTYAPYIKGKQSMPSFYSNLGSAYREKGDYQKAMAYYRKSLELQKTDSGYENFYAFLLLEIARNSLLQNKPDEAIGYAKKSLEYDELKKGVRYDANEVLYEAYKKKNNAPEALRYLESAIEAKNTATKEDLTKRINALQFEYDNQKKALEITTLNQDLAREDLRKKLYIGGIILLIVFGGWFWRNNEKLKAKNTKIEDQQRQILAINKSLDDLNKNLEQKVKERTTALQEANEELLRKNEEIMEALVEGQTIERKRVASELHDNLGSTIAGLIWQLEGAMPENLSLSEKNIYESLIQQMRNAYTEVRHISHNLLPVELEKKGLKGALEKFVNDINLNDKLSLDFSFDEKLTSLDKKTELEVYSICMELITNILKHSKAKNAALRFEKEKDELRFTIQDNGIGINIDPTDSSKGRGLKNLQTRIKTLNGKLSVQNSNGTVITVQVPLTV